MPMIEFEFRTCLLFYLHLCLCGETCLLISWCTGGRCGMVDSDDDHDRSRRPGAGDRG
jgi:hypothetical protein